VAEPAGAGPGISVQGGLSENVAGALCYVLGLITGAIFLAIAPYNRSKFVRFHAFQAIFFHVALIIFWVFRAVLWQVLPWGAFAVLNILFMLIWVAGVALWVFLMVKALNREKFKLPIIGDYAERQA
jgi:uncharacterized membrane protein